MKDPAKSLLVWTMIIPLAIANGIFRESFLIPHLGSEIALPVSGIILSGLILLLAITVLPRVVKQQYGTIALVWIVMTIAFETLFGLTMGKSFAELITNYDITTGNLWLLVVITTGIAPLLAGRMKRNQK